MIIHNRARWGALALVASARFRACSAAATQAPATGAAAGAAGAQPGAAAVDYSSVTPSTTIGKNDKAEVTGAGSTAIYPWLSAVAQFYQQKVAPGVAVNYQAIGSGGGIAQFQARTVDFGASDIYLTTRRNSRSASRC